MRTDHRAAAQSEPVRRRRISSHLVYLSADPLDQHPRGGVGQRLHRAWNSLIMHVRVSPVLYLRRARTLVEWLVRRDGAHAR